VCIEDYRIGRNIWSRTTNVAAGGSTPFAANPNRVGIRLCYPLQSTAAGSFSHLSLDGTTTTAFAVADSQSPNADVTLPIHGNLVYGKFTATAAAIVNCVVTEFFLDNQETAPSPAKYPSEVGPMPISTGVGR
jgi:hypothetical protein